jgi:response regulator of citrate/malate metabolism
MYLEDNLGDFFLIEEYLYEKFEKFTISHCYNYSQAQDKLTTNNLFPLILLDIHLSDSAGIDLITAVLEKAKGIPVIILTGFIDDALSKQSFTLGVSDFLMKDDLTAEILHKSVMSAIA